MIRWEWMSQGSLGHQTVILIVSMNGTEMPFRYVQLTCRRPNRSSDHDLSEESDMLPVTVLLPTSNAQAVAARKGRL